MGVRKDRYGEKLVVTSVILPERYSKQLRELGDGYLSRGVVRLISASNDLFPELIKSYRDASTSVKFNVANSGSKNEK